MTNPKPTLLAAAKELLLGVEAAHAGTRFGTEAWYRERDELVARIEREQTAPKPAADARVCCQDWDNCTAIDCVPKLTRELASMRAAADARGVLESLRDEMQRMDDMNPPGKTSDYWLGVERSLRGTVADCNRRLAALPPVPATDARGPLHQLRADMMPLAAGDTYVHEGVAFTRSQWVFDWIAEHGDVADARTVLTELREDITIMMFPARFLPQDSSCVQRMMTDLVDRHLAALPPAADEPGPSEPAPRGCGHRSLDECTVACATFYTYGNATGAIE